MSDVGDAYNEQRTELGEAASEFMPYTGTVKHSTASGGVISLTTVHSSVPCRVKPSTKAHDVDAIRGKQAYDIEMPMYVNGTTFNTTKVAYKIDVDFPGVQPDQVFQVHKVEQGVWTITALCTIEG